MFVMTQANEVILPMLLREKQDRGQNNTKQTVTTFAGLKSFIFDTNKGITPNQSINYQEKLQVTIPTYDNEYNQGIDQRQMQQQQFRVGFVSDILYTVTNDFAHFYEDETQDTYIPFDPILKGYTQLCADLNESQCMLDEKCEAVYVQTACTIDEDCDTAPQFTQCQNKEYLEYDE